VPRRRIVRRVTARLDRDHPTSIIFLDESGSISQDRFFAVGCLKLTDASTLLRNVQRVRDKFHFYGEFHFTKLTKQQLNIYKTIVDEIVAANGVFGCFVADRQQADPIQRFGTSWAAYEKLAVQLLIGTIPPAEVTAVIADNYSAPAYVKFETSVKNQVNRRLDRLAVIEACRIDSKSADPLQLVDLLTSAVAFEFRSLNGLASAGSTKGQLSQYVRSQLGVSTFVGGCRGPLVHVREYEHGRWLNKLGNSK
jgi:Protein of unknown function (DUF3800)